MFPSRGCCHGVFLLAHAARQRDRPSIEAWVDAARNRATFMSKALDLHRIASGLLKLGLADIKQTVVLRHGLDELSTRADTPTLVAIARLLLQLSPPNWLRFVVRDGQVVREYAPTEEIEALSWIGSDLDELLLDVYSVGVPDSALLSAMGEAAELLIVAALSHAGSTPMQVSKLSASYGYDIECLSRPPDRIEVKAASQLSQNRFHISRNEFDKSSQYAKEWRLVQVVFTGAAFVTDRITQSHVAVVRQLKETVLSAVVPRDTAYFRWSESAEITTTIDDWIESPITLDPAFSVPGFLRSSTGSALTPGK